MEKKIRRHSLSVKIMLMFLVMLVLVVVALGFATYKISYNKVIKEYSGIAVSAGKLAAETVDTNNFDTWLTKGADQQYFSTEKSLSLIKQNFNLKYLYISMPVFDDDGNMINDARYVFDVMVDGEDAENFSSLGSYSGADEVGDIYEICKQLYYSNEIIQRDVITMSDFGWLLSCYVPLTADDGDVIGWVGIDIDMKTLIKNIQKDTLTMVSLIVALIAAFAVIFLIYISKSVIKPVKELSVNMNEFVLGGSELNYKPVNSIKTGDEIEQMADDFNSMAKAIMDYTVNLKKTTAEKERMRADLDVSEQIRASLSSFSYPAFPDRTDFDVYASMKNTIFNKSSFCDCFLSDKSHLFLVVGESSGTGLASMLFSTLAATNIRCFARMGYQPYRIAMETNNQLCGFGSNTKELSVETIIAQIDLKNGVMKYVNAGMPPVLLKKTGQDFAFESSPPQFNIGEMPNVTFSQESVSLSQGDTVMLMSKGVPQMCDINGMEFTTAYVQEGISYIAKKHYDLKEIIDTLEDALERFRRGAALNADTSMLIFRYFG